MKEKNKIDQLFQEGLKEFNPLPPAGAWDSIKSRLDQKKKRDKVLPLWWQIAAAAAVALVILSIFLWNPNQTTIIDQEIVEESIDNSNNVISQDAVVIEENSNANKEIEVRIQENYDTNAKEQSKNLSKTKKSGSNSLIVTTNGQQVPKNIMAVASGTINGHEGSINNNDLHGTARKEKSNLPIHLNNLDSLVYLNNTAVAAITQLKETSPVYKGDTIKKGALIDISIAGEEKGLADIATKNNLEENITPIKKWSAATVVAPVYTSSLSGSSVNDRVARDNQKTQTELSYGLAVSYTINNRWVVRTGLHQVNMSYNNENINYGLNTSTFDINDSQPTTVYNADAINARAESYSLLAGPLAFNEELQDANLLSNFNGELSQRIGYLEIPLEVKYRILNKKFGVSLLGGFSALFLTDNSVSIANEDRRLDLGEDSNFNDFNQSANLGLGLDYQFTENIGLSLEPTFKYQLNSLRNETTTFRPYILGIYTGLSYKF